MKIVERFRGNKVLGLVFVFSLAINILFVGAIAGRLMMPPPPRPMPPGLEWLVKGIPSETREKIRIDLSDHKMETRNLRQTVFKAQRRFNRLLMQEELNEADIRTALAHLRKSSAEFQGAMHEKMISIILGLDLEDRKKALIYLKEHRRGRPRMSPEDERPHARD